VSDSYDLVIIGGGSAGLMAVNLAAHLGARVALVERDHVGGDCTWTGCVPSKALIKTARVAHQARTGNRFGLPSTDLQVNLHDVMAHVHSVVDEVYQHETPDVLRSRGIDVYRGAARFLDAHTLTAGAETLTARRVILATGAHPLIPPIKGLAQVDYMTYQTLWDLDDLPEHLFIVGGGPVGCEMAQAFARLGSQVTLIQRRDRLLPRDEPEASNLIVKKFVSERIELRLRSQIEQVWQDDTDIHVSVNGNDLVGDALLLAAGRRPNVDGLDLERAGIRYDERGIQTDRYLRTSRRHIYAAGDCIGSYQFTHYAGWQGFIAARNALLPGRSKGVADWVPWTTFTDPEIAHAGLTEEQAQSRYGDAIVTYEWPMEKADRARTERDKDGFIKLTSKRDGTLVGVTIVAGQAGEMIHEWIAALHNNLKLEDLVGAIHVYPTYSTANMQAAFDSRRGQLLSGLPGRIARALARLRR
jgi:pyruvate/2-oxoglutarate dehydrogenase complex dihydrolipoamide dehydrogenase (E3) component